MVCHSYENLELQALVDSMTPDEADQFLAAEANDEKQRKAAVTRRQRVFARRYPVWRAFLRNKFKKLAHRLMQQARIRLRRRYDRLAHLNDRLYAVTSSQSSSQP